MLLYQCPPPKPLILVTHTKINPNAYPKPSVSCKSRTLMFDLYMNVNE